MLNNRRARRLGSRLALVPILAVLTLSCSDDDPTDPDTGAGNLTGVVTRHKTGVGLPGVIVVLLSDDVVVATAHTDADGHFDFGRFAAGRYTVRLAALELAGLDARFDAVEPESRTVDLAAGTEELLFTIVALVPPRITGAVMCNNVPADGARVRVVGGNIDLVVTTSVQGRYSALDLTPGNYAVIPVDAPCAVEPSFHALELLPGQSGQADFSG